MRSFDQFRLDVVNQCLWRGETQVALMPKPFAVLQYLVDNPRRLVTHDQLLAAIWPNTYVQPEVLRRYILEIRRALGDNADAPRFVRTIPKRGYQFIAPVVDDVASGSSQPVSAPPTLVGRQPELAALQQYMSNALGGRREIVFAVGEPGIGKTSLVDVFHQASETIDGVAVARGQCVEGFGGKEAYYPLLEALGQLARGPSRALVVNTLASTAPTWLIQFPSLVKPEQQSALERESLGATRERMVRELCEALETIAREVPVVLILEDLHWVDRSTVDAISALARRREQAKLLVLGTFRPADLILSRSPLKALKQDLLVHHLAREIELERLREGDVADYIAAQFAPGDVPRAFATIIHRHSDGNPLFMTTMLDHLVQHGVLARADGGWRLMVSLDRFDPGVPDTLKQLLEMQLQHLSDAEQQVLKCASVGGQTFTSWAVATMSEGDVSAVEQLCDALADRHQFVKVAGLRELSNGVSAAEYHFRHALYREVLYRRLNPTLRATFHRRLAEGLEQLCPFVEHGMAAEIASHFEHGHVYDRGIRYLMLAAENATRRYAHQQAVVVLEHAREILPRVGDTERHELDLQTLEKIGNAYYALGDMAAWSATYREMANRAAEAGLLASQADVLLRRGYAAESVPFFLRAAELNPHSPTTYVSLSRIYSNLGEGERATEFARLAYKSRDDAGERDRLSIEYQYHYEVTGDQSRATATLEEWKRSFPLEFQPANSLTVIHNFLGRFERAIEEGDEAMRRNPSHGYPYSNLAHAYRGAGQFEAARRIAERAVQLRIETLPTRRLLYQLALLDGDEPRAQAHIDWARDKPREFDMVGARAQAIGWFGRVREARQLYEDAARMARLRNLPDVGMSHLAWATTMELAYGNHDFAAQLARRVLDSTGSYDPCLRVSWILALIDPEFDAEAIASALATANPAHTLINEIFVPIVRAAVELRRERPRHAIEELRSVAPYELGFVAALVPVYLRGLAHMKLGAWSHAAEEFMRLLAHRGSDPFSPFHAVALVGLARARAGEGNVAAALTAYDQFLADWTDADADVPVLLEARDECRALASHGLASRFAP